MWNLFSKRQPDIDNFSVLKSPHKSRVLSRECFKVARGGVSFRGSLGQLLVLCLGLKHYKVEQSQHFIHSKTSQGVVCATNMFLGTI